MRLNMSNTHSVDLELSSSQYLSITDAAQTGLGLTGSFSLEFWAKVEQLPSVSARMTPLSKWGSGLRHYAIILTTDDKLQFTVSDDGSDTVGHLLRYLSDNAIVTTGWNHYAVTFDIGSEAVLFYKNGVVTAATKTVGSTIGATLTNHNVPFYIGGLAITGYEELFDGKMKDVRVWSDVRTASEILANYRRNLVGNEANLVACWPLNNDLLDITANNNDLTNNNSATFATDIPFFCEKMNGQYLGDKAKVNGQTLTHPMKIGGINA